MDSFIDLRCTAANRASAWLCDEGVSSVPHPKAKKKKMGRPVLDIPTPHTPLTRPGGFFLFTSEKETRIASGQIAALLHPTLPTPTPTPLAAEGGGGCVLPPGEAVSDDV
eukprot:TRINITY_DN66387_c0_g1_i1.p3 TRINITY_DN66387_c0_g1~~TRINITY_DN66387_c0_g1_i1.p3  ORF type:complete len:110 (+),score=3.93 TRINITY_DN66387_c0_g1_i1:1129-1458(+)